MRSPRFAYKKEEQSNLEILEMLTKYAFPLSNELVGHESGQSSDWPLDPSSVISCLYNPFVSFSIPVLIHLPIQRAVSRGWMEGL